MNVPLCSKSLATGSLVVGPYMGVDREGITEDAATTSRNTAELD